MKRSPMKRSATPMKRTPMKQGRSRKQRTDAAEMDAATPEVLKRARGRCEAMFPGCTMSQGLQRHHRQSRRFGDNRAVNLLYVCDACHRLGHSRPEWARSIGFLVNGQQDPAETPFTGQGSYPKPTNPKQ